MREYVFGAHVYHTATVQQHWRNEKDMSIKFGFLDDMHIRHRHPFPCERRVVFYAHDLAHGDNYGRKPRQKLERS